MITLCSYINYARQDYFPINVHQINPLLPNSNFSNRIIKFFLKKGSMKEISYERRVYESVDDESLS